MRKLLSTKLERITYLIICMWIVMGCTAAAMERSFSDLAVYFLSLSGFAATYAFGEMKRPSQKNSLFLKGPSSSREVMMYWVITIWFFLGMVGLAHGLNLQEMGAYFASLTPFVSAFIVGSTFKPEIPILKDTISQDLTCDESNGDSETSENLSDVEGSQDVKPVGRG
jgi:di/tricarboxylate transporter